MISKILFYCLVLVFIWSCKETAEASSDKEILSFEVFGQIDESIINSDQATVFLQVDSTVNLASIKPEITISNNAKINPASNEIVDFSQGSVNYTVTAEDNTNKPWEITIETIKSDEANITSFYHSRQKKEADITDTIVTLEVKLGTNLATLKPTIGISDRATISPSSLEQVDFSQGAVIYTVTAESGRQQKWVVNVIGEKIYEANILTFTVPNQIGESVFDKTYINIEVPVGYDLTNVVPTLTITEGTTVDPESGEAVNFAEKGYVDYTVTTEINTKKLWRVFLSEYTLKPNDPKIQYIGRVDFTNPLKPRLYAPGTAIKAKFKGTYCQILIDDQEQWGNHNFLEIIVDGTQETRIQTTGKKNTIDIVKDLTDGEHTLTIVKNTEAGIGYIDFVGFRCDELLEPDALPERRIEFIGNSITCGYGVDDSQAACGTGGWFAQHSAYYAYGPEVARRLNSQWMLSSESGIGLIHSCCDKTNTINDIYQTINLAKGGAQWDFSSYQANVVTVCLGQNDGVQDSVDFCSAYVNFIGTIRSKYPNASIICLTSPMADDYLYNSQKNYLTGIVDYMNTHNDTKVYKCFLTHKLNSGCDSHPNKAEHQTTANELETFIKEKLGW